MIFFVPHLPLDTFHIWWQDPSGILVHPSGTELSLHDAINGIRSHYGDKQGKLFRIWVDQILSTKIGSDTWLVKFNQWELSGEVSK